MKKKPSEITDEISWLEAFLGQFILERDLMLAAYRADGETLYPDYKRIDDQGWGPRLLHIGGILQTNLEICYAQFGNRLRDLLDKRAKVFQPDAAFFNLEPILFKAWKVHESCIESLRRGKGWNWEKHGKHIGRVLDALKVYKAQGAKPIVTIPQKGKPKPGRRATPGKAEGSINFLREWERAHAVGINFKRFCKDKGLAEKAGRSTLRLAKYHLKNQGK